MATGHAESATEHGDILGPYQYLTVEVAVDDVAGLEIQQFTQGDGGLAKVCAQLDFGVLDLFTRADSPTVVLLVAVARHAGIEHFTQRRDHGVGHGDVQLAAAAVELD